jgi:hypothetical protein
MREGRQMGIFSRAEATQEKILTAAMGAEPRAIARAVRQNDSQMEQQA